MPQWFGTIYMVHSQNMAVHIRQDVSLLEKSEIEPSVKVASQIARALDNCIYKIFDLDETGEYLCTGCECDNRQ